MAWLMQVFHNKTSATHANKFAGSCNKTDNIWNKELAEELHKPVLRKFNKRKVY